MTTYQDVIVAEAPSAAWALSEASGTSFAPYVGGSSLSGSGTFLYRLAAPTTPFGFALGINAGAKMSLLFIAQVNAPDTFECWYKLPSPLPADQYLYYNGTAGVNGTGFYVRHTDAHVLFAHGSAADIDTGAIFPLNQWNLVEAAATGSGQVYLALNGVLSWQQVPSAVGAPSPNTLFIGASASTTSNNAIQIAWPAFYAYALSPGQIASDFVAESNPDAALNGTVTGGLSGSGDTALLNLILSSVRKTYTAP